MSLPPAPSADAAGSCVGCAVSRRTFLSATTLAALAIAMDACGSATGPDGGAAASGGPITVTLSNFPALNTVGGLARVDSNGSPTALVRTGASTFIGVNMICTHQGSTVNIQSGAYVCPNHGARYAADGTWTGGQQTTSLQTFPATYNATAGTVVINRPS